MDQSVSVKICCIINGKAGGAAGLKDEQLTELFARWGFKVLILWTNKGQAIVDLVNDAKLNGYTVFIAGGGDGTVNAVARELIGQQNMRLGILPIGTLNHLAKDLNIPMGLTEAVEVICGMHCELIDVGEVSGLFFLNNSSLGLYPSIVKSRETQQRTGRGKWWSAILAFFAVFSRFRTIPLEIKLPDGRTIRRRTALLFVGNNSYETNATAIGTRHSLQNGVLWVRLALSSGRWHFIKSLVSIVAGGNSRAGNFGFETTSFSVSSTKKNLAVATDGEVQTLNLPLNYQILPRALRVIVPQVVPGKPS